MEPVEFDASSTLREGKSERVIQGLRALQDAYAQALASNQSPWQFSLTGDFLMDTTSLTPTDLKTLQSHGLILHAREIPGQSGVERQFRPIDSVELLGNDCFVLSSSAFDKFSLFDASSVDPGVLKDRPIWRSDTRELWFQDEVVLRIHREAPNQFAILAAFEEEGWPIQIDDPIPGGSPVDSANRRHDAVKRLNRNIRIPKIKFRDHVSREAVSWTIWPQKG